MPGDNRFRGREHIRRQADFDRVYARRCSAGDDLLRVCGCENGLPYARLGLSVGRKWGKAHVRNRLRRLYREAFRLSKEKLPVGIDYVLIPRRAEDVTLAAVRSALERLCQSVFRRLGRTTQF